MKKLLSLLLSAAIIGSAASVTALADSVTLNADPADFDSAWDADDELVTDVSFANGRIDGEAIAPNTTIYVTLNNGNLTDDNSGATIINTADLLDSDLFKFKVDKDTNSKMISSATLETEKKVGGSSTRSDVVIKLVLADSTSTSEIHTDGDIIFTAKKSTADLDAGEFTAGSDFVSGDEYVIPYSIWISNEKVTNDANPDAGDRVYFSPDENDSNTLVWDEDRAALEFEADDDASDFYARLSTSVDRTVYAEYGDPVDAELWFFDFVGSPTIPSTSRATLTLGVPWNDDDDYVPDPESCYLYQADSDGYLVDVTDQFVYSEDDREIPGWSIKTRSLGTYILSDTELDVELIDDTDETLDETVDEAVDETTGATVSNTDKEIPQTGSSDMVNVAVAAAVTSLTAAGALAFHKVQKN